MKMHEQLYAPLTCTHWEMEMKLKVCVPGGTSQSTTCEKWEIPTK
jgi:hypothetical protein